jgi:hypothetical protein
MGWNGTVGPALGLANQDEDADETDAGISGRGDDAAGAGAGAGAASTSSSKNAKNAAAREEDRRKFNRGMPQRRSYE